MVVSAGSCLRILDWDLGSLLTNCYDDDDYDDDVEALEA